ncbi:MAG TPA: type I pullulanase [Armatimonadota bacterium]|jgi:pullulanase
MILSISGGWIWVLLAGATLCAAASAQTPPAPLPAFLDGLDTVTIALPEPEAIDGLKGRYSLTAASGSIAVTEVLPGSRPVRNRRLPRTPGRVVLAGSFQPALGGEAWDPDGESAQMTEVRPGVFELAVTLPKGHYEYKIARGGSWGENYGAGFEPGGQNIPLDVSKDGTPVRIVVDFNTRVIRDSIRNPKDAPPPDAMPARPAEAPQGVKYDAAILRLARPVAITDVSAPMTLKSEGGADRVVYARDALTDRAFQYVGDDLGARWTAGATAFKVWSPVSESADLLLYTAAKGGEPRVIPMRRLAAGVWYARVTGDLHGAYYRYRFRSYGETREAADIYCFAAGADGERSMVVDLKRTNPAGWPGAALPRRASATDAVIYETHVRDFTVLPSSGVRPAWRGKYPGMAERNTRVPGSARPTGADYLMDLGVTDVHLLPIQSTVTGSNGEYDWGYATTLFNVPEEQYSTTPNDPVNVIRETKAMVAGLHKAGLRVVLDVVYNHTWPPEGRGSAFWQTVPYYYCRTNDRGEILNESGVGNATADERPMVRKFVRDSLLYWLREYNVDGFRFDLLGMHTPESVADWAKALRAARPDVLIYGEPWTGGGPLRFGKGAQQGMGVAVFNDTFRGALRGDTDGAGPGFAMGADAAPDVMRLVLAGSVHAVPGDGGFTATPSESVNYVSAHDNLSLWDKARRAMPGADDGEVARAVKLATAAALLSEGIPFLEGGVEIGRTKGGIANSYNANDAVNGFHWDRAPAFSELHDYVRGLIALRKSLPALRLDSADAVERDVRFPIPATLPPNTVTYTIPGAPGWTEALVILHGARTPATLTLPEGRWQVLADERRAGVKPLRAVEGSIMLPPLSAMVLAR